MVTILVILLIIAGAANLLGAILSIAFSRRIARAAPRMGAAHGQAAFDALTPFVSIHVAIHDEPPDLVIASLNALARSDYAAFEVIVIDNNTLDAAVWRPVSAHVKTLGGRFRFYHFDEVEGAKAGALNLGLQLSDPRTAYVGIVDADYQVSPDFIAVAVSACGPSTQFVQFPQAYRHSIGAEAVVAELSDYFATFPSAANRSQASLLTGTLSLISIDALRRVGGWPTRSITEDAELGLRLWRAGARGLYIDREAGHGLLPMDLDGLRLQRRRWVTGNVQTLIGARQIFACPLAGSSAVLAQLTAWLGLLAIPLLTLVVVAVARAWPLLGSSAPKGCWQAAEWIAIASFGCVLLGHVGRAIARNRFASLAVTSALLWTSSFAWLGALGPRRPKFYRTPKRLSVRSRQWSLDTLGSAAALLTAAAFLFEGAPIPAGVLMFSAAGLITAPFVDRSLRRAAAGA